MHQLTDPGWWLSFASIWLPWYLFCVVASVVALPLCLRVYRGLADRGASLSIGIGLLAMNLFSWLVSIEWFGAQGPAGKVRVIWIAGGAVATVATLILQGRGRASGWLSWVPAALLFLIGFAWLPHGFASALFGLVATGLLSALAWQGDRPGLFREVRLNAAPLLVSHLLFLVGFAFFANVRSYIPYATYDRGLFLAEKWGNYQHLSAIFRSTTLPPRDLWFSGAWTNYYYGGHLLTATIAKAIGTPQYIAFNLGLATIFALTLSMGFGFVYSLVRLASVRSRIGRHLAWHHGMGWALFGAAAIALFGNLDPWRQLLTRDSDYGAQQRITRRITSEQEEWKLTHGVPAETVMALRASVAAVPEPDRLSALVGEIARQRQQRGDLSATHRKMLESAGAVMADQSLDRRARENALLSILVPSTNTPLYRNLLSVNSVEIEEELAREITAGEFDAALKRFEAIPVSDNEVPALEALGNKADELLEQQVASAAFDGIDILLADETRAKGLSELTHLPVDDLRSTWSTAAKRPREQAAIVREWLALMEENSGAVPDQGNAEETLRDALGDAPAAVDVDSLIRAVVGSFPPDVPSDFDSAAFRYSWENVSQIDFWAPSRAIKGTPPGVAEEGTITEFPYFSALLGDHHPHHMALAWTLAALAACVSVLRRTSRRCADEAVWLGRALPGLVMMALLIGYVFSVNIWDAVVLAPIYALVVCVSRRGVRPLPEWRWVGLAGFALLIPLVLCLLVNASPVTVPLFQEFKAFLLAWALVGIGIPVALYLMPSRSPLLIVGVLCSLALALVIAGAIIAPGIGGETPVSPVYTGLRDGLVFLIAVALAALWTLRDERSDWANWWYGCGFVYMVVGLTALLLAAPFKAFFQTPLFPSVRLLNTATPPTIGFELVERPDIFWTMFWRASPVNPFPWGLRTELGDFFLHWGIFLIPVLVFAVWRVLTMLRDSEPAKGLCLLAIPLAIAAFARIYLQYWTGALCLALVPVALWLAVGNRRRAEGPAWVLLAGAFLWCWFVEALHFDDDYSGNYERYNTPFKIYYPLWPIFAGAMVVALRETAARFAIQRSSADEALQSPNFWLCAAAIGVGVPLACAHVFPNAIAQWIFFVLIIPVIWVMFTLLLSTMPGRAVPGTEAALEIAACTRSRWPALVAVSAVALLGLYYPLAATVTRTREFFTWPIAGTTELRYPHRQIFLTRTLDATEHYGEFPEYRQDWKAWNWLRANTDRDARILERPSPDGYASTGRMAAGAARISILNWKHHEEQWRGRARPAYTWLKETYPDAMPPSAGLKNGLFAAWPGVGEEATEEFLRDLRLASDGERIRMLRATYPKAPLATLYRMRRVVEQNDMTMSAAMQAMLDDSDKMYRSTDENEVRRLFGKYDIRYVVVGALERAPEAYGADIDDRLLSWGFTEVYNSGAAANLTDGEPPVENPTIIYEPRPSFAESGKETSK